MAQCLGERLYRAYETANGRHPGVYAALSAQEQAAWNRVAVGFVPQLSDTGEEWDSIVETCAQAAEAQDRVGREWVRDSLWAEILKRAGDNVRALKRRSQP